MTKSYYIDRKYKKVFVHNTAKGTLEIVGSFDELNIKETMRDKTIINILNNK